MISNLILITASVLFVLLIFTNRIRYHRFLTDHTYFRKLLYIAIFIALVGVTEAIIRGRIIEGTTVSFSPIIYILLCKASSIIFMKCYNRLPIVANRTNMMDLETRNATFIDYLNFMIVTFLPFILTFLIHDLFF